MKKQTKYKKPKSISQKIKEPSAAYKPSGQKELSVFNSFEEAEEAHLKYLASLTGEQHLANAVAWIKRLYAKDLKKYPKLGTDLREK